jgi:BirA family biotin operon repressor/biotin-[acetyl-CoA-carboxylase] ligase
MDYSLLLAEGFLPILGKWKKHAAFLGRKIVVTNLDEKLVGLAVDVDEEGKLLLKTENRVIHKVTVGDVSLQLDTL